MATKPVIICVDDEPAILETLEIELHRALDGEYLVEVAESGGEALELIEELSASGYQIALIIADYIMPGMKGDELLRVAHQRLPDTLTLMLTGQATPEALGNAVNEAGLHRYIAKPWSPEALRLTIREAVHTYEYARLKQAEQEKLRLLDQLKDQFLDNTSHELRTPLNGIIGFAELLNLELAGTLDPAHQELLSSLVQCSYRLHSLVNDILDFSRLKQNTLELNPGPVNLRAVAARVVASHRAFLQDKAPRLSNRIPEDLPPALADEDRLQQILQQLISNAVKFTSHGEARIDAGLVRRLPPRPEAPLDPGQLEEIPRKRWAEKRGVLLAVSVEDNGIGIEPERLPRLFESFEQLDGSSARSYEGIGLGLSLVRHLVERHGGEVFVESSPGRGSRFVFTLPLADGDAPGMKTTGGISSGSENEYHSRNGCALSSRFHEILVVADNVINQKLLRAYLNPPGYRVDMVNTGEAGLARLHQGDLPNLVLLDLRQPGNLEAGDFILRARESWSRNELPLILLCERAETDELKQCLARGANDYLFKPLAREEVQTRVALHLSCFRA